MSRLQSILLFRELQFPLKEIREILDSSEFDPSEALAQQIELLELQYRHLGELISFACKKKKKGVRKMDFRVFDTGMIEQYKAEVKKRWGGTREYQEYEQRQEKDSDFDEMARQMMTLIKFSSSLDRCTSAMSALNRISIVPAERERLSL